MNTSWKNISTLDGAALVAEFTRRITEAAKSLPTVGKLRHRSKMLASKDDGAPLANARKAAEDAGMSTSCVDNAAQHERVFAALVLPVLKNGKPLVSEEIFDDLTYRQAITLDKALSLAKNAPAVMPAIEKYLGVCKFRDGWTDTVLERAEKAANPVVETPPVEGETPPVEGETPPVEGETPPVEGETPANVIDLPNAKPKTAPEATALIMDAIRIACHGLTAKQIDLVRANLARACNAPDAFASIFATMGEQKAA